MSATELPNSSTGSEADARAIYGDFGRYYDLFYGARAYHSEVEFADALVRRFAARPPRSVLELGCGTGAHSVEFLRKGYTVTGIDQSAVTVAAAEARARSVGAGSATFKVMDMRALCVEGRFDLVVSLFGPMSYLLTDLDFAKVLAGSRSCLHDGGHLLFDFWNAEAVRADPPHPSERSVELPGGERLHRTAIPEVSWDTRICNLRYAFVREREGRVIESFDELHRIRFFERHEVESGLVAAGFEPLCVQSAHPGQADGPTPWFLLSLARARS